MENTSVRSHSPDIAESLNQEMSATQVRLQNVAGNVDNTMTIESAISMKNEENEMQSNRSGSSDGSLNKRTMKSNIALAKKRQEMQSNIEPK